MEHFSSNGLGYNKEEVNDFVDYVIKKTEENVTTIKSQYEEIRRLQDELEHYKKLENTLDTIYNEKKDLAEKEATFIINEAKDNASRIINDSLVKAKQLEMEKQAMDANLKIIKKKVRNCLLEQLNAVEEIETL